MDSRERSQTAGKISWIVRSVWRRYAPLLIRLLASAPSGARVLDAAMGIGCESIYLAGLGYQVTGNEYDEDLNSIVQAKVKHPPHNLSITALDWRTIAKSLGPNSFDLILLLGNSLCMLSDKSSVQQTLDNIFALCRRGGVALIDERNYRYIMGERKSILAGNFRYRRRVVYCGTKVDGAPSLIDDNLIRFSYMDVITRQELGSLDCHPFAAGELMWRGYMAGFTRIDCLSDLEVGFDPLADFYSYIFRKT